MGMLDIFVLTPAAAALLEERLRDSRERIIGEDIFKSSMLDDTNADMELELSFCNVLQGASYEGLSQKLWNSLVKPRIGMVMAIAKD